MATNLNGSHIPEGAELAKLIEKDKARSADGGESIEEAQAAQFAETARINKRAQERNHSIQMSDNAFSV